MNNRRGPPPSGPPPKGQNGPTKPHHHNQQRPVLPPSHQYPSRHVPKSFDESSLPSMKDGISLQEERLLRRKTCRFIEQAGRILQLPRVAIATGMVFFHRFYAKHSFKEHDRFEVAVSCILLAAKTEESPKKLSKVIVECYALKNGVRGAGRVSSSSASSSADRNKGMLDTKGQEYAQLKERILLLERVILHTIAFELSIDHPYKFLVDQCKKLNQGRDIEYIDPSKSSSVSSSQMIQELVQNSMSFANDSMHTSLCLQFSANTIAMACVYMSAKYCRIRPTKVNNDWCFLLNISIDSLVSISEQIMELIADKKGSETSSFKTIRQDLDKLKSSNIHPTSQHGGSSSSGGGRDMKRQRNN